MNSSKNEIERLAALKSYQILDTGKDQVFEDLTQLVSYICDVPMAMISFMDHDRHWHKARIGLKDSEAKREETFCQYAILSNEIFEVENTQLDTILKESSFAKGEGAIKFYASASLNTRDGLAIGNVCVMDHEPKKLNEEQRQCLRTVAQQVMTQLELRKLNIDLKSELEQLLEDKIRETKQKLQNKEKEANYLKESIDQANATLTLDFEGNVQFPNENFCRLLSYDKSELIGKNLSQFMPEDFINEDYHNLWEALRRGNFQNNVTKFLTKDNEVKYLLANYNPVKDTQNRLDTILVILQDVTNEVKYRQELEEAKKTAEKALVVKDQFLSNMSHEIRTPLNAIIGFTDILKNENLNEEQLDHVHTIATAGDNLLNLINDILDLSKIESGKLKFEKIDFELNAFFNSVVKIMYPKAKEKGIELLTEFDIEGDFWVKGDPYRFNQILFNLINNAIKFTEKGNVTLSVQLDKVKKKKVELLIKVKDTGIGIAEERQKAIYDRFTQADSGITRKYGGTGLGLSIVRLLIQNFKGKIKLDSTEGKGTTFSLNIPLEIGQKENKGVVEEGAAPYGNKKLYVLMVEDNLLNQKLGRYLVEGMGYELEISNNGKEAIKLLEEKSFDLILMDLQMPVMDGYRATEIIREELKIDTPIIAMTAHSIGSERDKCLAAGMNDFITKPFKIEELTTKIERINYANAGVYFQEDDSIGEKEQFFSMDELKKITHGNAEFLGEVIKIFVTETSKELFKIKNAFEDQDYNKISDLAHKLKSSYRIIGFKRMDILAHLEDLKHAKPIDTEITSLIEELTSITNQIFDELKEIKIN